MVMVISLGHQVRGDHFIVHLLVCMKYYMMTVLNTNFFLEPHAQHMEMSRLGVKLEPLPPAYTTATATQDPSRICDLHHSSWQ